MSCGLIYSVAYVDISASLHVLLKYELSLQKRQDEVGASAYFFHTSDKRYPKAEKKIIAQMAICGVCIPSSYSF